jgi:hypothetical protein
VEKSLVFAWILDYRQQNGGFKKIEDLHEVRACVPVRIEHRGTGSQSAAFLVQGRDTRRRFGVYQG